MLTAGAPGPARTPPRRGRARPRPRHDSRHAPCAPRRARGSLERPAAPATFPLLVYCAQQSTPARSSCRSSQVQLTSGAADRSHQLTTHPSPQRDSIYYPLDTQRESARPRSRQRSQTHNGTHEIDETRRSRNISNAQTHTRLVYTFCLPSIETIDQRARASLYVVESKARIQPQRQSRVGGARSKGSTHA